MCCWTEPDESGLDRTEVGYSGNVFRALSLALPVLLFVSTGPDASLRIGKAELSQARALLSQARNELQPRQWEMLDNKLASAERAWERFDAAARASGRAAEVPRAQDLSEAVRASKVKGIRALPKLGPLLVALVLLWPAKTAGPEHDEMPSWLSARLEFEAKLEEVSKASQQVSAEIETAHRGVRSPPEVDAAKKRPPEAASEQAHPPPAAQGQPARDDPPCELRGSGGPGPSKPAGPKLVTCRYMCGDIFVELDDVPGTSGDDCEHANALKRAARKAAEIRREHASKRCREGR